MATYTVSFTGRRAEAIGSMYRTSPVRVVAETREEAIALARQETYRMGFDHLVCPWCDEVKEPFEPVPVTRSYIDS